MSDEDEPEINTNYGLIPTGDAYREELTNELDKLIADQEKRPSEYKEQRIKTLSHRLGREVHAAGTGDTQSSRA